MLDDGALENPSVDALIGLHTGDVFGVRSAPGRSGALQLLMAAVDRFQITFRERAATAPRPSRRRSGDHGLRGSA
ncbi:hypothetical protein MASR1M66_23320 [Aminivibrio sp.]